MSTEMVKARIDVVVVVFNPDPMAIESMRSLRDHDSGLGRIMLVDNYSTRNLDTVATCRELADVNIRPPQQVSLAAAWNLGIAESTTDHVVITNDDILYTKDWLPPLIEALNADQSIGVLQPYNTLSAIPDGFPHNYQLEDRVGGIPKSNFVGCCFAINKGIYVRLKEYDQQRWPDDPQYTYFYEPFYPFGSEDQDFYRRVRECGFHTMAHFGSYIHHFTGQTMKSIPTFEQTKTASMRKYERRWSNLPDLWHEGRPE